MEGGHIKVVVELYQLDQRLVLVQELLGIVIKSAAVAE